MTIKEKQKFKSFLDKNVETYIYFVNRSDYPDKPCVSRAVDSLQIIVFNLQNIVFNLAEILYDCKVIAWEECCEYWAKVGLVDEYNNNCKFKDCSANINGVCKYANEEVQSDE